MHGATRPEIAQKVHEVVGKAVVVVDEQQHARIFAVSGVERKPDGIRDTASGSRPGAATPPVAGPPALQRADADPGLRRFRRPDWRDHHRPAPAGRSGAHPDLQHLRRTYAFERYGRRPEPGPGRAGPG